MDDTVIMGFDDGSPLLRLRHCYEGTIILGRTGSGKTTGSGEALLRSFIRAGLGGLVHCAKPDEADRVRKLIRAEGRGADIVTISPDTKWRFNFLRYEQQRPGRGAGHVETIVHVLYEAMAAFERGNDQSQSRDPYWERAAKTMLRNAVTTVLLADARLSLERLTKVIFDVSEVSEAIMNDPAASYASMVAGTEYGRLIDLAVNRDLTERQKKDLEVTENYWRRDFGKLKEQTRASVISTFTAMADGLMRGVLADLFGTATDIFPELSRQGTIFILDLDVKEFLELGKVAQVIFKTVWQRAMERQPGSPVFLFADEFHNFVTGYDVEFQSTARSSKTAVCLLTQNISLLHRELAGKNGEAQVAALMGNLANKFFHQNDSVETNNWASETIGMYDRSRVGVSGGKDEQIGWQTHHSREYRVPPEAFLSLRTGGPDFNGIIDAIFFRAPHWRIVTFRQFPREGKQH